MTVLKHSSTAIVGFYQGIDNCFDFFFVVRLKQYFRVAYDKFVFGQMGGFCINCATHHPDFIKWHPKQIGQTGRKPPYYKYPDYKHNFTILDSQELAGALKDIKGNFMLSINDHPEIREVFHGFHQKSVSLLYTVSSREPVEAAELIYSNFQLKEVFPREVDLFQGGF